MAKSRKTDKGRHRENRGTGMMQYYIPWLRSPEVPSRGRSHRPWGIKTRRNHEFFSDLEEYYFLVAEWCDQVIDIREQYPLLPVEQTQMIAKSLGYKHPQDDQTGEPYVMSTDFLLTVHDGDLVKLVARTIKSSSDLENPRVREKFAIEREFWKLQGVDWAIVTDEDIPINMAKNLKRIRGSYFWHLNSKPSPAVLFTFKNEVLSYDLDGPLNLSAICISLDKLHNFDMGYCLIMLQYLIWNKEIVVDMNQLLNFRELVINKCVKLHLSK